MGCRRKAAMFLFVKAAQRSGMSSFNDGARDSKLNWRGGRIRGEPRLLLSAFNSIKTTEKNTRVTVLVLLV